MADSSTIERASRELATLVQRRGLVFMPMWATLAILGLLTLAGVRAPGDMGTPVLVFGLGFLSMVPLARYHRRRFGSIKPSDADRTRGYALTAVVFIGFFLTLAVGTRVTPSPVLIGFGVFFLTIAFLDVPRVSWQWLLPAATCLALSAIPGTLMREGIESALLGLSGTLASVLDHMHMLRAFRHSRGGASMGAAHA